jgi:hypothetical protein
MVPSRLSGRFRLFGRGIYSSTADARSPLALNARPADRTDHHRPDIVADIEASAKRQKDQLGAPAGRGYNFRTGLADNAAEFAKLGGYGVMLLTVISQKSEELPRKRVYIQSSAPEMTLQRLSNLRGDCR